MAKKIKETKKEREKHLKEERQKEEKQEKIRQQRYIVEREKEIREVIAAQFAEQSVITESSDEARELYNKSAYGKLTDDGRVQLSLIEAFYLLQKGKIRIYKNKREINLENLLRAAKKVEPNFWIRYCVFKDIRDRGYIIKTALKFGADFRVYERGIKPGEDHAKWIVYPVY
ncbi:MAG: tRNA-intron lyase, partial [Candidatus Woesearchaeota archaeon]|nr:tRNA-intron lyase [Candidatus Woesearchaeota archaeon]